MNVSCDSTIKTTLIYLSQIKWILFCQRTRDYNLKKRLMSMPQNGAVISVGYKGNLGPIINGTLKTFSNMLARILA